MRQTQHDLGDDGGADIGADEGEDRRADDRKALLLEGVEILARGNAGVGEDRRAQREQTDLGKLGGHRGGKPAREGEAQDRGDQRHIEDDRDLELREKLGDQVVEQAADDNDDEHVQQGGEDLPGHMDRGGVGAPLVDHVGNGGQDAADEKDLDAVGPNLAHAFRLILRHVRYPPSLQRYRTRPRPA